MPKLTTYTPDFFGCKGDYDPIGNRGTDDTVNLQKAIDACVDAGWTLSLGRNAYLVSKGLTVGSNVASRQNSNFSIVGDGMVSDDTAQGCSSITVVGQQDYAIKIGAGVYRGAMVGGFRLMPKPTLDTHVYWSPQNEDQFSCKTGIVFDDQSHSSLRFEEIYIGPALKTIAYSGKGIDSNGEFTTFRRIWGGASTRFFYMAPNTGQALGHKFYDCLSNADQISTNKSGFAAFELGGGGGGFDLEVYNFNSSCLLTGVEKATSVEQLNRATLVKNNGVDGHVLVMGGRNERYTTLYENVDGRVGGVVLFKAVDMAGMLSGRKNPTIIGSKESRGVCCIEQVNGLMPFLSGDAYAADSFVNIAIPAEDRAQYIFRNAHFGEYNQITNKRRSLTYTYGKQPTSRLKFEDCVRNDERGRAFDTLFNFSR